MKVEQIYTGCLAHGAYYIESNGEAAIIDPLRETKPYTDRAAASGAKIKYILETHFHADFVSGHLDLSKQTGAEIVYGPTAEANFPILRANDRQVLPLGNVTIEVLHTPGHTMESSCFLLRDEHGNINSVFTGDTLFLGDVGRPDLAVKSDLSKEQLAGFLFDSIWNKIMPLPDHTIVYPGHGAGSACGKNMSDETVGTLGHQKETNYALQTRNKTEFVAAVLEGQTTPPQYFPKNAVMNKMGYDSFVDVLEKGLNALDPDSFEDAANRMEALIIDTRHETEFVKGFVPNSIFIGIDGNFAPWVGTLIVDLKQPILVIADSGREEEVITRLSRVGYDNAIGFLKGGIEAWKQAGKEVDTIEETNAEAFAAENKKESKNVIDVRKKSEYDAGHVEGAKMVTVDYINDYMNDLHKATEYYLYCKSGYRSVIAASILKSRGFEKLVTIAGGYEALVNTDINMERELATI
ncbi:MBL fold metallo-hydrolase [bacterium]|nr:MBL fold metallo-hydrolase [bacterium]